MKIFHIEILNLSDHSLIAVSQIKQHILLYTSLVFNLQLNYTIAIYEFRVGKKVVNMSIDRDGGQYWSAENSLVSVGFFWSF
jgi:hypothetical protein